MRHILRILTAPLLAAALAISLSACGDDGEGGSGSKGADPAAVEAHDTTILDQTNAGGSTSDAAVPLRSQADVEDFLAGLQHGALTEGVQRAFDRHADDQGTVLLASVVAIGCEVPEEVTVSHRAGEVVITPKKVAASKLECLAAVTSVALVVVDESALSH